MSKDDRVAGIGLDCHRAFSNATARDTTGKILWRKRLEHADRRPLRRELRRWPKETPVVLEGTFGWGWLSDELQAAGLEPYLASSKKVAAWRDARGIAKSNWTDADLLSELWSQQPRWWEVWLAPREVRDQREWLRYRMSLVAMQTCLKNQIHAIYVCWKKDVDYADDPPVRPGSLKKSTAQRRRGRREVKPRSRALKTKSVRSRPGTGQPDTAMVVAPKPSVLQISQ